MNAAPKIAMRRLAAALVVLAAVFHVQWLAACDLPPMIDSGGCCTAPYSDDNRHCDDAAAYACLAPIAKHASNVRLPERADGPDESSADPLPALLSIPTLVATGAIASPYRNATACTVDGRVLYLTSSRLRL